MTIEPPEQWVRPEWMAPVQVRALATTRHGGTSQAPFSGFNLGNSSGDDPEAVAENRRQLTRYLPAPACWLNQVHGNDAIHLKDWQPGIRADAAWTDRPGQVAAILTADCLPILLAEQEGRLIAAIHAGWRGLANGIIEQTMSALPADPERVLAWIGPGISQAHYEVDKQVRSVFLNRSANHRVAFKVNDRGRFQADLKRIAFNELQSAGVSRVVDSELCTAADPERFYSYRRDHGRTGRQATLIWLA